MTSLTSNEKVLNGTIEDYSKVHKVTPGKTVGEPQEILPYCLTYLTPALIKEAVIHLNETEENKTRCLREFRNFIKNQKNLVTPTDDLFLLGFLRARKFDLDRTYKLFLNFWKFRKDHRFYFKNINVDAVLELALRNFFGFLEHRDKNGASVVVFRVGQWDPEVDSYESMFLSVVALLMISLEYPANQVAGMRVIFDFRGLSWKQLKYCTPSILSLFINSTQFSFPGRYKGFHMISDNKFFKVLWSLAHHILSRKIKNRMFFHTSDLTSIRKYIHPSVLPVDFGGDAPAFELTKWKNYYTERIEKIMELSRCGYID